MMIPITPTMAQTAVESAVITAKMSTDTKVFSVSWLVKQVLSKFPAALIISRRFDKG